MSRVSTGLMSMIRVLGALPIIRYVTVKFTVYYVYLFYFLFKSFYNHSPVDDISPYALKHYYQHHYLRFSSLSVFFFTLLSLCISKTLFILLTFPLLQHSHPQLYPSYLSPSSSFLSSTLSFLPFSFYNILILNFILLTFLLLHHSYPQLYPSYLSPSSSFLSSTLSFLTFSLFNILTLPLHYYALPLAHRAVVQQRCSLKICVLL